MKVQSKIPYCLKEKKIIIPLSIFMILFLVILILFSSGGSNKKELNKNLNATFDVVLGRSVSDAAYISDMEAFSENSYTIFANNEIAELINSKITYDVKKIEIDGTEGKARVEFSAPDVCAICKEALKSEENFKSSEEVLEFIAKQLNDEYPTLREEAICEFEYVSGCWYWIPSKHVLNILSGNMYQFYEDIIATIVQYEGE